MVPPDGRAAPTVKLLDKTLRLLSTFSPARPEWGVTELATRLALPKSTVHRILRVLTAHRYLAQHPGTARFRLGLAALELGRNAHEGLDLERVARPTLERLARVSGETVLLMVVSEARDRAVCVERVESRARLRLILEVGTHAPLHAGASSKVLLAHMTPTEIERVIAGGLPRLARGTITSAALLRRDLARIRQQGYARSSEETNEGAAGVAAPVLDPAGRIVAGVSIVGPLTRLTERQVPRLVGLAEQGAREIAAGLGLAAPPASAAPADETNERRGAGHSSVGSRRGRPRPPAAGQGRRLAGWSAFR